MITVQPLATYLKHTNQKFTITVNNDADRYK